MVSYFFGILLAFVNPVSHSWANVLDSYFSNKLFQRLSALILFSELFNVAFLAVVLLFDFPKVLPTPLLGVVLAIALIEILYQYPYYWALRRSDTSVVASLFSLGKIFIPVFAFLLVKEHLTGVQYAGFLLIILSTICLTLDFKKFRLNEALLLMLAVSILLSLQSVLFKYLFDHGASWGSVMVWTALFQLGIAGVVLVARPKNLHDFSESWQKLKDNLRLVALMQLLSWVGSAAGEYAIFLIPVSVVSGITGTQPIFVLLFALLFAKTTPHLFKEYLGSSAVWKKIMVFLLVIAGTLLITVG